MCRLINPPASHPFEVLQHYKGSNINKRDHNRIAGTIQYLQKAGAQLIATAFEADTSVPTAAERIVEEIKQRAELRGKRSWLHAYTDGSTQPGGKSCNSGAGIYITDHLHKEIWKGGFHVRTDKNNFIAEMAAASTVIKALPEDCKCTLWIDSMAAIQALKNGVLLSERRRIRSAGRLWLNWMRPTICAKQIQFQHVRSHTGLEGPAEFGNEMADSIANSFRLQGDKAPPDMVDLKWEEDFCILDTNQAVVQGDVRAWAKKVEQKFLLEGFSKCELQFTWMKKITSKF